MWGERGEASEKKRGSARGSAEIPRAGLSGCGDGDILSVYVARVAIIALSGEHRSSSDVTMLAGPPRYLWRCGRTHRHR